ncbi:hypothetical protein [Kosakonia phage Kc304]|nr:hypothetical protein [Kosakonia phage Kc304]UYM28919.1 hypothetical protein [Serratia phage vB_SspM_LC53]
MTYRQALNRCMLILGALLVLFMAIGVGVAYGVTSIMLFLTDVIIQLSSLIG